MHAPYDTHHTVSHGTPHGTPDGTPPTASDAYDDALDDALGGPVGAPLMAGPPEAGTCAADPLEAGTLAGPVVLDRRTGPHGEVVLRRHGDILQIIANGCFLMDSSDGRSERLLVDAARDALAGRPAPALLIGGLGIGFSLAQAAADPRWGRITVVEREQAIIDWHGVTGTNGAGPRATRRQPRTGSRAPLAHISGGALADPRTRVLHTDLVAHVQESQDRYDALCLDIDNGPGWTVTEDNAGLYSPAGLGACRARLTPGGVLAVWSAQPSPDFEGALRCAGFRGVHTQEIPVARGVPDVVHLAIGPG